MELRKSIRADFMKNFVQLVFVFIIACNNLFAQSSIVSVRGHITAEVIPIFSASEMAQMNFGRFSPGPHGGEIVLSPESTISVLGSVYKGTGTHNAACYYISGEIEASFTVTLPQTPVIITHASSAKTMTIENWLSNPGTDAGAGILQDGSQNVYIGATLKVGTLQDNPVGIYAGTYSITFDFN